MIHEGCGFRSRSGAGRTGAHSLCHGKGQEPLARYAAAVQTTSRTCEMYLIACRVRVMARALAGLQALRWHANRRCNADYKRDQECRTVALHNLMYSHM